MSSQQALRTRQNATARAVQQESLPGDDICPAGGCEVCRDAAECPAHNETQEE